jgi:hypothetical protein
VQQLDAVSCRCSLDARDAFNSIEGSRLLHSRDAFKVKEQIIEQKFVASRIM